MVEHLRFGPALHGYAVYDLVVVLCFCAMGEPNDGALWGSGVASDQ